MSKRARVTQATVQKRIAAEFATHPELASIRVGETSGLEQVIAFFQPGAATGVDAEALARFFNCLADDEEIVPTELHTELQPYMTACPRLSDATPPRLPHATIINADGSEVAFQIDRSKLSPEVEAELAAMLPARLERNFAMYPDASPKFVEALIVGVTSTCILEILAKRLQAIEAAAARLLQPTEPKPEPIH